MSNTTYGEGKANVEQVEDVQTTPAPQTDHHHHAYPQPTTGHPVLEAPFEEVMADKPAAGHIHPVIHAPAWQLRWEAKREWLRPYFAECFAVMIYVTFGCGSVAQFLLGGGIYGSWLNVALAFGLAIAFAVYLCAPISGGHTNPAITVTMAIFRGFPWRRVPGYIISQIIGGFIGACLVYAAFYDTINMFDGGVRQIVGKQATSTIWCNLPAPGITTGWSFWTEFLANAAFTLVVFVLVDENNPLVSPQTAPIMIGLSITTTVLGLAQQGVALNPARDLGPRIFVAIVYGPEIFQLGNHFFWIPMVAPFFGCITSAFIYDMLFYVHPQPQQGSHALEGTTSIHEKDSL
ncbi:hypothetical protein BZG36_03447 [Bifiguratus adelaidae]|uniref:Uncharacterized protein n=1 Tax=Bifiguratus adelaidae TaxID=1938954 RepID=A0A261XYA5_9FUNG|nr:hypothetical protein BZG36_03447 [Bifiguratus adelaidae]